MKQLIVYDLEVIPRPLTRPGDKHREDVQLRDLPSITSPFTAHKLEMSHEKRESALWIAATTDDLLM